ncbi:GNAT family N-acetyltransferase [Aneurinibacillus aneurinilyticus]|uniref:GNAT family N-acetyltransferase n=1 Tax=Aneurinibacillus aneurinilyticus TaxID=1391 RepID=A0A848D6E0_ANEAE|nr:GNAT family N-acetyltransferase [Aneurinibacillus aneurinilyticus]NMF01341.1 GNAT family N-acetyltransferase [Aneurinibacillus aneurinilyticus]
MKIELQKVSIEEKHILRHLLELYQYDFSEFDLEDVNESGLYGYTYLDHYWTEEGRYPFLFRVGGKVAGFALIRQVGMTDSNDAIYSVAEFFVMKKYRRTGVGRDVAFRLFDMFKGSWKIAEMEENKPAQEFWRKTIKEYTKANFKEIQEADWDGPIQIFRTR